MLLGCLLSLLSHSKIQDRMKMTCMKPISIYTPGSVWPLDGNQNSNRADDCTQLKTVSNILTRPTRLAETCNDGGKSFDELKSLHQSRFRTLLPKQTGACILLSAALPSSGPSLVTSAAHWGSRGLWLYGMILATSLLTLSTFNSAQCGLL